MSTEQEMKVAHVLAASAEALEKTAFERDAAVMRADGLQLRLDAVETRLSAEKLASEMHEKGLNLEVEYTDLVDELVKSASEGKLPVVREAVKMAAPNMGHRIGNINTDEQRGAAGSDLEAFLVGDVG